MFTPRGLYSVAEYGFLFTIGGPGSAVFTQRPSARMTSIHSSIYSRNAMAKMPRNTGLRTPSSAQPRRLFSTVPSVGSGPFLIGDIAFAARFGGGVPFRGILCFFARGVGRAADHELVDAGLVARAVVFNAIVVIDVFPEFRPGLRKDLPLFHRDRGDAGVDSASFRIADDADANGAGNKALLFEHFHIAGRFDEAVGGRLDHRDHFFGLVTAIHADAFFQSVDARQRILDSLPLELVRRAVAQVIIASREDAPDVVAFL